MFSDALHVVLLGGLHRRSKSDFWLNLHRLANDLEKEGETPAERVVNLLAVREAQSPATLTAYLENLDLVTATLAPLVKRCHER